MTAENVPAAPESVVQPTRPRIRWAGIVWGAVFAGLAVAGVWLCSGARRIDEVGVWASTLDIGTAIAGGLIVIGSLVLVTGLVGLLRRAQVAAGDGRAETDRDHETDPA